MTKNTMEKSKSDSQTPVKVENSESSLPHACDDSPPDVAPSTAPSTTPSTTPSKSKPESLAEKPKAFTIKYKRPRGSRACVVCRSRKVRCDAEIHIPCTNCITFGCECTLPEAKKRGNASAESKAKRRQPTAVGSATAIAESDSQDKEATSDSSDPLAKNGTSTKSINPAEKAYDTLNDLKKSMGNSSLSTSEPVLNISQVSVPPSLTSNYKTRPSMHKRELINGKANKSAPNPKASLTFLGSSSISLMAQKVGQNHVQLTEDVFDVSENFLDSVELEILKLRGAFLLPSNELALDIINSYFEHVHPLMPVINRTEFMKKFKDPDDSPSLMLLQAVLLCGCRVSKNPQLLDAKGSNNLACLTFFRRAKALYETGYESDPLSIIQTVILIGSYWEGPEDVTRNSFYWTRVAVGLAQGYGFQRDVSNSNNLSSTEKKVWRRIWWCLFEKDRNVAIAFGRPTVIDLNDCDVPMVTVDDFIEDEDETGEKSPYPVNETQALYFIHLVKLAEITGIIIKHQYTVKAEQFKRKNKFSIIQHCDMLMGIWFTNLPSQLVFSLTDPSTQNFYSSLLNAQYYNRLYLIHRANLLRMARSSSTNPNNYKYPSWGISFQAARMISIVSKILYDKGQLRFCPVMFVYILFSALMMLIYHVDSPNSVIASTASDSLFISRAVMKELGLYWPVAGVLMKLFDKYANDKIKRAVVIENGTRIAELEEINATKNALSAQNTIGQYTSQATSSRPRGNVNHVQQANESVYIDNEKYGSEYAVSPGTVPAAQAATSAGSPLKPEAKVPKESIKPEKSSSKDSTTSQSPKLQVHKKLNDESNNSTPPSSAQSFPEISLVTEDLPTNQNFFDNFEPTQLFPNANFSMPLTRAQSPSNIGNQKETGPETKAEPENHQSVNSMDLNNEFTHPGTNNGTNEGMNPFTIGSNVYGTTYTVPNTPGGEAINTNFIDSSFINMNMQSNADSTYLNDDLGSLFNM